jgi:hypothetical protein
VNDFGSKEHARWLPKQIGARMEASTNRINAINVATQAIQTVLAFDDLTGSIHDCSAIRY